MVKFLKNTVLVLIFSAVLFALIEVIVRQFFPQTVRTTYLVGETLGIKDPVTGHLNRPNTHAAVTAPEFSVEYIVDERGFRNASLDSRPSSEATATKVLLVGDSFVFGAANHFDDIWPELLANRFKQEGLDVEVINAGVPGFDTSQQVLYLERLFETYQPDIVLLTFLPNDLFANRPIQNVDGQDQARGDARAVVQTGGSKKSSFQSVTLLKRMMMGTDAAYRRLYLMTPRKAFFENPPSEKMETKADTTKDILMRAKQFTSQHGADFVVLSVPQLFQVLQKASGEVVPDVNPDLPDQMFEEFSSENEIDWIATLPVLAQNYAENKAELYYRFDGHLNAEGNRVVADIAYDALEPLVSNYSN
ncbi:GDSL-type esterase/lipase family protein [Roseibium sp. RKSG952]|uniref:SGNH/GDSL hydrolase family protein n=1 Tax=Roseibium sp. RKSG952 TaxID=2529384 RepID=UPI0012BD1EC5|nr:GDSL-type esterase/lipase family protein [Roseibium sp. RKSG952]MTH97079.1 hypothetical protein [Roseibium sp. RKSG952]